MKNTQHSGPENPNRADNAIDLRGRVPREDGFLRHTLPDRQRLAKAYLKGQCPGVQQSYAPNAKPSKTEGWVEDDETVERLARWRREAPYG